MFEYTVYFQNSVEGSWDKNSRSQELGKIKFPYPLRLGEVVTIPESWIVKITNEFANVNKYQASFWVGDVLYHIDENDDRHEATVVLVREAKAISNPFLNM
ncbi:hypothetical protein M5X06_00340 [Paenibacillus alvei]|uniref:Phage protein n=1 Tax=Paenibacillus alvei TaxID=44250 RepID=A0ABT4H3R6_PAEAL|nr:hypothetical protein [Paenibacillus alvei]MCY9763529.1 hypothetical protein [Paenibacillus alvei]MCY9765284.1 hypothetical protein [Paenibacillus alvei]NEZ44416.1 hypothetical protein [Paenibacillus alvei]